MECVLPSSWLYGTAHGKKGAPPSRVARLQGQAQFRVFERAPQYFLDAAQAIEQRVAMQVHGAGRLAQVAVAAKVCLQCLNQRAIAVRIVMDQRTKRLLVEVGEFTLLVKIEEQPVDAQARKRVDLPIAEQPPPDFQRLLGLAQRSRNPLQISGNMPHPT